ncbi:acyl transferase/acyl hydrolase/lysophospholipase [Lophiotrema nucula]|uniref:Acyl transferase/acyl hydrolase/lysophospholipase n=1 Tax=Lophiotrema nucula TaxID=690887 RepID=A0A6A5Z913_9PLEO|nr:acyl transferase/acyl hydrolase/lysophospholipase [Lophiotrema nucula]
MDPSTAEANPHAPLRLLSLDGGGVRGLSSLMVLDTLMAMEEKRLGLRGQDDQTQLRPCNYLDLIGGTSTGGIIAIILSRLRLDCKKAISIYTRVSKEVIQHDRSLKLFGKRVRIGNSHFSSAVLAKAIKSGLKELGYDEDESMWDDSLLEEHTLPHKFPERSPAALKGLGLTQNNGNTERPAGDLATPNTDVADEQSRKGANVPFPDPLPSGLARSATWKRHHKGSVQHKTKHQGCRGFVMASLKNAVGLPRILSTYDPNDRSTRIWEALRATCAAPKFFEEIQFGVPKITYLDGSLGFNNPCAELDFSAKALWGRRPISLIVSVGTGSQSLPKMRNLPTWLLLGLSNISLVPALTAMASDPTRVDNEMARKYQDTDTAYYRLDVDRSLSNASIEQWMQEDQMATLTSQYLNDLDQIRKVQGIASLLAKQTSPPTGFEISATQFLIGIDGRGSKDKTFEAIDLDCKRTLYRCLRADKVGLRAIRTGIPPGSYRVNFMMAFHNGQETTPHDLILSVGKPTDVATFTQRFVDVELSPDAVPQLLQPDAMRVRVGKERYLRYMGKGWLEIEGNAEVKVGLDGVSGFVVSKSWKEDEFIDGWSFKGVRMEPMFGGQSHERTKSAQSG